MPLFPSLKHHRRVIDAVLDENEIFDSYSLCNILPPFWRLRGGLFGLLGSGIKQGLLVKTNQRVMLINLDTLLNYSSKHIFSQPVQSKSVKQGILSATITIEDGEHEYQSNGTEKSPSPA
jgi:hypothetical protein